MDKKNHPTIMVTLSKLFSDEIHRVNITYGQLMEGLKNVLNVCEERVLMNLACYMFNTICGIFNTISAYKTEGTPIAIIVVHLTRVINCAARISVMCCAASSVVDQASTNNTHFSFKYCKIT